MAKKSAEEPINRFDNFTAGSKKKRLLKLFLERTDFLAANKDTSRIDEEIKKIEESLKAEKAKVDRLNAAHIASDRKRRTRRLYELGGLLVKAGWEGESSECILGMLIEQKNALQDEITRKKWEVLGKAAMSTDIPSTQS